MLHVFSRFTLLVPLPKRTSSRTFLLPLLRHSRSLAPQVLSSGDLETERARTNSPIPSFSHPLDQEKNEEAANSFKNRLSKIPPEDRTSRFNAYEGKIKVFLKQKLYKNAIELYQQMCVEGFYPSSGLRARMLVCSDIVTAPHEQRENLESLYEELSRVLSLSSYLELSLHKLLDDMLSHPLINSQFVSKLVDVYVKSRGPKYKLKPSTINQLIVFYTHAGDMDMVESLVFPHRESADNHQCHTNARSYTTLISVLTKKGAMSSTHIGLILDRMKQSHIPVDLPLMNALIQSAVRRGNLHQAFSFYEDILKDPASHMIPDSFTFGSLFNALQSLWAPRSQRPRRVHPPPNAPTPRRLFRQMLECHVLAVQAADADQRNTGPEVCTMRVSTLNVALRLFMLSMDYPAAFVVLQTFRGLGLRPDARTYRFVLTILIAHVKASLRPGKSRRYDTRWALTFLGDEGPVDVRRSEDIRPEITYAFLEFARACGDTQFRAPGLAVIMGDKEEPKNAEWDIEPLERLVVRAILARMPLKARSEGEAERAVREKLAPVFYELVPDRLWKGRRLRRAAY